MALAAAGLLAYQYREKEQNKAADLRAEQEKKAKAATRIVKNAPSCFTVNTGHYFRFKVNGKWKKVRKIEQVPLKRRKSAQCRRALK